MARRFSFVFATGLLIAVLLGACSNGKSADVTVPTLAVLPSGNPQSTQEAAAGTPSAPTLSSQIQSGVDQLFTQTAQAQQQIAPTQTIVAAFNQALTATGESIDATELSQFLSTEVEIKTESALTATSIVFPTLTPFTFPTQNVIVPPTPQQYIPPLSGIQNPLPTFDLSGPTLPSVGLSPTPMQITIGSIVVVNVDGLNLRKAPGLNQAVVTNANQGDRFTVIEGPQLADDLIWWHIQDSSDRTRDGWVAADYLDVSS